MTNSCTTAPAFSQGHWSTPHYALAQQYQAKCTNKRPTKPNGLAAACVQAETVLDVVENLAFGQKSTGATITRNAVAKVVRERHRKFWTARQSKNFASIRLTSSFGASDLVTPCGLHSICGSSLWAASLGGEKISEFSPQGDLIRHVSLPGSMPWGLFQAGQDSLWVCDFADHQLLRVGLDGTLEQRLNIETGGLNLRAIQGAAHGNDLFLILADNTGRNRQLALLRKDTDPPLEFLPCPVTIPSGLRVHGERLYLSSQNPPALLSRPLKGGAWVGYNTGLLPDYMNQFAFFGEHTWLAARGRLTRLSATGTVELVIAPATLAGYPESNFSALTALDGPDGPCLFVADTIHNLIHSFQLG